MKRVLNTSMECVDVSTFIGREITTLLNIAVDNVILKLSDACDYFAKAYIRVKKQLRTVPTIVIAHTFCASPDTRISYRRCLLIQGYFCAV